MRRLFKGRQPAIPRTLVALWLRAGALRQDDLRARYRDGLRRTGWHDAGPVAGAAFKSIVTYAFTPPNRPVSVEEMVRGMRAFFGRDGVDRIPQDEGELLIRAALDEDVSVSQIPAITAFTIHGLVFVGLALDLSLSEDELNTVLIMAEESAFSESFSPTLASDVGA